jgi:DNA-binding MarR family transcriptional regulator
MNRSLHREFLVALIETSRHLRHFVDQRAQRLGLTGAQLRALSKLKRHEGSTQAELAALMEMRPISLSGLIDKLTHQGLVERRADQLDRRINRLHLTHAGRDMSERIETFREEVAGEVLTYVDIAALSSALFVFQSVKRRLKEQGSGTAIAAE